MSGGLDVTGLWIANGGVYHVHQVGVDVWWVGFSMDQPNSIGVDGFQRGVQYTNVFHGTLENGGTSIVGEWADIPRGENSGSGRLTVTIVSPSELQFGEGTGGFGERTWRKATIDLPDDILFRFAHTIRNDGGPMGGLDPDGMDPDGHLKIYKDNVVAFGTVIEDLSAALNPNADRRYANFICNADGDFDPSDIDGDVKFKMRVDRTANENPLGALDVQPGFWDQSPEWLNAKNEIQAKLDDGDTNQMEVEAIMYGRQPLEGDCDGFEAVLLPGWMESGTNSVLLNGRPINGEVVQDPNIAVPIEILGQKILSGRRVRVTGALCLDCHGAINECGETDPGNHNVEIHPVYAIDLLRDPQFVPPSLNGVWAATDVGTYYLRQIGQQDLWWLGLSRDRGLTFITVFRGTIDGNTVTGHWAELPRLGGPLNPDGSTLGAGFLSLGAPNGASSTQLFSSVFAGPFAGYRWEKLYDTLLPPPPSPIGIDGPTQTDADPATQPLTFSLHPADIADLRPVSTTWNITNPGTVRVEQAGAEQFVVTFLSNPPQGQTGWRITAQVTDRNGIIHAAGPHSVLFKSDEPPPHGGHGTG